MDMNYMWIQKWDTCTFTTMEQNLIKNRQLNNMKVRQSQNYKILDK